MPPVPNPGESENDFIVRAHLELLAEIPETDERNATVYSLWRDEGERYSRDEDGIYAKTGQRFSPDQFVTRSDVPLFVEHEIVDRKGNLQKYDREALRAIVDRCNYRIRNTGNYSVLCDGHTPTRDQMAAGAKMPEVLGFVGPYRLGMIGNVDPKWAIFADEHYSREAVPVVQKRPNRSVEIWLHQDMAERFIDPVAALGAETPRLDLGMRFSAASEGDVEVERYSAFAVPAGSFPGSSSPGGFDAGQSSGLAVSGEHLSQLVELIMQTAPMQWVLHQMAMQSAVGHSADMQSQDQSMGGLPGQPSMPPDGGMSPGGPPPGGFNPSPAAGGPGGIPGQHPQREPYSMSSATPTQANDKSAAGSVSAIVEERERYARLEAELKQATDRLNKLEGEKRVAERLAKLQELRRVHVLDIDEEIHRCSKMDDEQFSDHCTVILKHYSRIPLGAGVYVPGEIPVPSGGEDFEEAQQYSRKVSQLAQQITLQQRASGKVDFSYEQGLEMAREQITKKS